MNSELLLEHYERIAEAPDATARLRRFILDLAVRGKLVEQDAAEEPASALLKRISVERARLVKAGEIRKPKQHSGINYPIFALPDSWAWVAIRDITSDRGQQIPNCSFTYIDVTAINKQAGVVAEPKVLSASEAPSRARKITQKGDVIYSCVRPSLLNVAVIEQEFEPAPIASTAFAVLNGYGLVLPRYIWIVLRTPYMVECVESTQRGQAYPAINDADFALLPFPLPPLAEQHRIVAKVEELMALCDQLEYAQSVREKARCKLTLSTLAMLNERDAGTLADDIRFALERLEPLTKRTNQIKPLKQTILNLALRGAFASDKDLRDSTIDISPTVQNTPKPYQIPSSWRWLRMDEGVKFVGGSQPPKSTFIYEPREGYTRLIQIRDFKSDQYATYVPSEKANRPFCKTDVMIGRYGPPVFQILRGLSGTYNVALMKAVPIDEGICSDFLYYLLQESRIHDEVVKESERTAGQTGVRLPLLNSFVIGVPPLSEQHRIVAKVEELIAICDQLEASLVAGEQIRFKLLEAVLQDTLEPA